MTEPGDRLPALGPKGQGWVVLQFAGLFAVLAGLAGAGAWRGAAWAASAAVGGALALAGAALCGAGLVHLGGSLTANPKPHHRAVLVERGVYARIRHPIYGGLLLGCVGVSLIAASWASLAATAYVAVVLWLKSMREEAWLVRRYDGYAAYRARTGRFFPAL